MGDSTAQRVNSASGKAAGASGDSVEACVAALGSLRIDSARARALRLPRRCLLVRVSALAGPSSPAPGPSPPARRRPCSYNVLLRHTLLGEEELPQLSREESALIDFYLGLNAQQFIGNSVSTFSAMLIMERWNAGGSQIHHGSVTCMQAAACRPSGRSLPRNRRWGLARGGSSLPRTVSLQHPPAPRRTRPTCCDCRTVRHLLQRGQHPAGGLPATVQASASCVRNPRAFSRSTAAAARRPCCLRSGWRAGKGSGVRAWSSPAAGQLGRGCSVAAPRPCSPFPRALCWLLSNASPTTPTPVLSCAGCPGFSLTTTGRGAQSTT